MRTTLGKRKLRKANNSVLGLIHARGQQRVTRGRCGDSRARSIWFVPCARSARRPLLTVSWGTGQLETVHEMEQCPLLEQSGSSFIPPKSSGTALINKLAGTLDWSLKCTV